MTWHLNIEETMKGSSSIVVSNVWIRSIFCSLICTVVCHTTARIEQCEVYITLHFSVRIVARASSDVLLGMNQEGQTSRWAVVCTVKLNRAKSKKVDKFGVIILSILQLVDF